MNGFAIASLFCHVLSGSAPEADCEAPSTSDAVLLVVGSADPGLSKSASEVDRTLRRIARGRLTLLPASDTKLALEVEGGVLQRREKLDAARDLVRRAEDKYRELDVDEALQIIAAATAQLSSVHQEPGALELLAQAHLLAGAIFLARTRLDAARSRFDRALDLDPDLAPDRDFFGPEVLAELASVRSARPTNPTGRVSIISSPIAGATVYLDGRRVGVTPLGLDSVSEGRHILRVSAPDFRSHVATIEVETGADVAVRANLTADVELARIRRLFAPGLSTAERDEILASVAHRAGAKTAILASLALSPRLSNTGTATVAVSIHVPGRGHAHSNSSTPERLTEAFEDALACASEPAAAPSRAPALLGLGRTHELRPEAVPAPEPFWEKPWFWGAIAVAALGVSGALVVARNAGGPPESLELTLVPRP